MNITHNDIGRDVICKNGSEGRIFYSFNNSKQLTVIVELEQEGDCIWVQTTRIDNNGQALDKELDGYSVKEFVDEQAEQE